MSIGKNIKKARKEKGLTQKELGDRLGVKQATISMFEKDQTNIKYVTVKKIADAIGVPVSELYDDEFAGFSKKLYEHYKDNDVDLVMLNLKTCGFYFIGKFGELLIIEEYNTGKRYGLTNKDYDQLNNTVLEFFNFSLHQTIKDKEIK